MKKNEKLIIIKQMIADKKTDAEIIAYSEQEKWKGNIVNYIQEVKDDNSSDEEKSETEEYINDIDVETEEVPSEEKQKGSDDTQTEKIPPPTTPPVTSPTPPPAETPPDTPPETPTIIPVVKDKKEKAVVSSVI